MNFSMPDALVILGVLGTIITALITIVPTLLKKHPLCETCNEHSGVVSTQQALNATLERLQDTMDRFNDTLMLILKERK